MEIPVDFPPEISASLLHCTRDPFLVWCLTSNFSSSDFSEESFSLFFYLFSFLFFSFLTILFFIFFVRFSFSFLFIYFSFLFLGDCRFCLFSRCGLFSFSSCFLILFGTFYSWSGSVRLVGSQSFLLPLIFLIGISSFSKFFRFAAFFAPK